jgi:hypothetical protein
METLVLPLVGIVGLYVINTRDKYKQKQKDTDFDKERSQQKDRERERERDRVQEQEHERKRERERREANTEGFAASYFTPNESNMVLYNAKSSSTNHFHDGILDANMGSGSQYVSKSEQAPLFAQESSVHWSHGMPSTTDYMQSRQTEIKSSKMTNVAPFRSIHVTPGNYSDNESRDRWKDKTVDELRTANNRKASEYGLYGHEGPAKHGNAQSGTIGKMEKNRVDRVFEKDQSHVLPSMGQYKKETIRPLQIERNTNRMETDADAQPYYGALKSAHESRHADMAPQRYEPSKRMGLDTLPLMPASATGRQHGYEDDYGRYAINSHNEKKKQVQNDYYGAIKGAVSHMVSPIIDTLRPSRKQYMIDSMTSYPRIHSAVPASYVYDPDDRPPTTNRESVENSLFHLTPDAAPKFGGYKVSSVESPALTSRDKTNVQYSGPVAASSKPRIYDADYNAATLTVRKDALSEWYASGAMSLPPSSSMGAATTTQPRKNTVDQARQLPQQSQNQQSMDREQMGQSMRDNHKIHAQPVDNSYALDQLADNPYSLHRNTLSN